MPGPADYFQQGFGQFGQLVQDVGEKSREPHPAIKRRIMDMLNNGMSPQEAATRAKLQTAGHLPDDEVSEPMDVNDPSFQVPTGPSATYGDGSPVGPPPPPMSRTQSGPMGRPPVASPRLSAPEPAFTMRDAEDAKNLGLLHDPRVLSDTPEDRMARAILRANTQTSEGALNRESRESQTTERVTGQKEIADASLKEKARQFDTHHKLEVDRLAQDWEKAVLRARTAIQSAREGRASAKDVAALKAVLGYDSAIQNQITGLTKTANSGYGVLTGAANNPDLVKRLGELQAQHGAIVPQIEDALKKAQQVMQSPGQGSTSERSSVSVPGPNLKAPDTSVPKGVGVAPRLPDRFRTRDGVWVKKNPATGKYEADPNQGN